MVNIKNKISIKISHYLNGKIDLDYLTLNFEKNMLFNEFIIYKNNFKGLKDKNKFNRFIEADKLLFNDVILKKIEYQQFLIEYKIKYLNNELVTPIKKLNNKIKFYK